MKWIGLTGGIGSGKSTVARMLKEQHAIPVVDADHLARLAVQPGSPALQQLVLHFGTEILKDGELDRACLAKKMFADPKEKDFVESVIHPVVQMHVAAFRQKCEQQGAPLAVYDIPLLFEKNLQSQFDLTVVVSCSEAQQVTRLKARNGWSEAEIRSRMAAQVPLSEKAKKADDVIQNEGSLEDLGTQVFNWVQKIKSQI